MWWPRSLRARTALVLLAGLGLVQVAGLAIYALDRLELQRLAENRDLGVRIAAVAASVLAREPDGWAAAATEAARTEGAGFAASVGADDPRAVAPAAPRPVQMLIRPYLGVPVPARQRPREIVVRGAGGAGDPLLIGYRLPDERWLLFRTTAPRPALWHSPHFLVSWGLMTAAAALLTLWATGRLTRPVRTLAAAAERLGRDVGAPPLPETGPTEVATAAAAFNTMAERIRRFVADRTVVLTAISHDLRTPITRLKLRAEWMEDEEQRRKMLADLDELEAMVSATLAFGRDVAGSEPAVRIDLAALLRTVLDEAADARPGHADQLSFAGPEHLTVQARPVALKRAMANLVGNAMAYGGRAHIVLQPPQRGVLAVHVEDAGPGIAPEELDRVFEPFYRLETSRNRETGGTGLGLPITRNILRAHGGDVTLANKAAGGLRATITLPA